MSVARILIADDHQLLADGFKSLLEPEFTVVGIVLDGRALVNAAFILKPDVIIVDIGMPLLNGLDAGERIKREMPMTKLVFLSMNMDSQVAADAFRKGASAYVTKQSGLLELALAVRKAIRGESYLSPFIARESLMSLDNKRVPRAQISPRQTEILQLLVGGMSMKQVADVLEIRPRTVAFHKYSMMKRINVKSNAELITYAIKRRMMSSNTREKS